MAIEFQCPSCQALIRTAPGTEGRPARCPSCKSVVTVPVAQPSPDLLLPKPISLQPINPYATPANPFAHEELQSLTAEQLALRAFSKLLWPAIGMISFALLGLGLMALVGLVIAMDPDALFRNIDRDPAQRAGALGFFMAYFAVGFVTRALQMLGAIAMFRQRGYGLALAGAISALVPCEIYCCLPSLPLGIWALIVLNNAEVKAAFGR
jgi:hypothetical protein